MGVVPPPHSQGSDFFYFANGRYAVNDQNLIFSDGRL